MKGSIEINARGITSINVAACGDSLRKVVVRALHGASDAERLRVLREIERDAAAGELPESLAGLGSEFDVTLFEPEAQAS